MTLPAFTMPEGSDFGALTAAEVVARGRNINLIDDTTVRLFADRVEKSGVLPLLEQWQREDSAGEGMGGRPAIISFHALLTALLLLAHESAPMHVRRAALLLQHRLSPDVRAELDLPTSNTTFAAHAASNQRWYNNTMRAFQRMNALLDPFPHERYTAKSYEQIQQILNEHDRIREQKYAARLRSFTSAFIRMTFFLQPRDVRRASKQLDVSFDQTYIGTPNPKGYAKKNLAKKIAEERNAPHLGERQPGPVDAFAGWHAKTGERGDYANGDRGETAPSSTSGNDNTDFAWGWVENLAVRVDAEAPGSRRFPALIVAASLSLPNVEVSEEAVRLLQSTADFDLKPGIADADKQYFANALPSRLLIPTLEAGFTPSTDYRVDRLGVTGGAHGALYVEGDAYCPSTPQPLLSASLDIRDGTIDSATYRARVAERKAFRLHVKQKADGRGKTMLRCPALGPSPSVTCPLREFLKTAAPRPRPHVEPESVEEEFLDTICRKHSASFDLTEMQSPAQAFDFQSEEWEEFHDHARNSIESENQQLKASGDEDIATAARRRVRGFSAAQIMITMLITNHNIRKIAAFLSDRTARGRAHAPGRGNLLRRRDRVWANRYTRTTGNGELTLPRVPRAPEPIGPNAPLRT